VVAALSDFAGRELDLKARFRVGLARPLSREKNDVF